MPLSDEMRRLKARWETGTGWPKRLDWIEIEGLRGWQGQRLNLNFPIMGIVGENGAGKSTILQAAAPVYRGLGDEGLYASEFFPDTTWDAIRNARIDYAVREGDTQYVDAVHKPTARWRRNQERRQRHVKYVDLSRIQPVSGRTGYQKLANPRLEEASSTPFEATRLGRFSQIMGRTYDLAKMALTDADSGRAVPVLRQQDSSYSGFHQGAGETTMAELLQTDLPQYGILLIDEIESSLHPRAQRRLLRDLARVCRENELQVLLTTHSPYVLEELPPEARAYIETTGGRREIVYGVSADFAMTKMDDVPHSECDVYVEDRRAEAMLVEILVAKKADLVYRCQTIPYGASSVGQALGQMVANRRFPRPSVVFLDGDEGSAVGCFTLPGDDAPERVVFQQLRDAAWGQLAARTGRPYPEVADACLHAMTLADHHDWVKQAAHALVLASDHLWQSMCAEWASTCLSDAEAVPVIQPIEDALSGILNLPTNAPPVAAPATATTPAEASSSAPEQLALQ